jgi:plastocyanin
MTRIPAAVRRVAFVALLTAAPVLFVAETVDAAPGKVQAVTIKGFAFAPQAITVAPGTTVTWTNADEDPHTVTASDKSFHSAALDSGGHFSMTFTKQGEFAYFCSLHPHMTGKVIVKG